MSGTQLTRGCSEYVSKRADDTFRPRLTGSRNLSLRRSIQQVDFSGPFKRSSATPRLHRLGYGRQACTGGVGRR